METAEENKEILKQLSEKQQIMFTKRGNDSLKKIFRLMRNKGKKDVIIQDQGGWMTYTQFAKKNKLGIKYIKTDHGIIDFVNSIKTILDTSLPNECFIIINSMPGYHLLQPMHEITQWCKENGLILINDVSGSIGYENAKHGDYIIGSFGNSKPIDASKGGFIAYNDEKNGKGLEQEAVEINQALLKHKLKQLIMKQQFYLKKHEEVVRDIKNIKNENNISFEIIHPNNIGINVIVKFSDEKEKELIIGYCTKNKLEFTECPRYIRVNDNAISIEVKRLTLEETKDV